MIDYEAIAAAQEAVDEAANGSSNDAEISALVDLVQLLESFIPPKQTVEEFHGYDAELDGQNLTVPDVREPWAGMPDELDIHWDVPLVWWTLRIGVHPGWVADGFEIDGEDLEDAAGMLSYIGRESAFWEAGREVQLELVAAPSEEIIDTFQGKR